jgi:ABC-type Fe3+-hydroxamate transport system substrate-binding protein
MTLRALFSSILCTAIVVVCNVFLPVQAASPQSSNFVDDWGRNVQLPVKQSGVAFRIVSLAPHATEILVAAGLQNELVAVDANSDFPLSVQGLPKLTSYPTVDAESLLATKANLLIVWGAGLDQSRLARLEKMVGQVIVSEPTRPEDVTRLWRALARISDQPARGLQSALDWETQWNQLLTKYATREPVAYVLQIWDQPLTVLSDKGLTAAVSKACRGRNVFDSKFPVATQTDIEALVQLKPKVWLSTGSTAERIKSRAAQLIAPLTFTRLEESILQRPGPRWIDGVTQVCQALDAARKINSATLR